MPVYVLICPQLLWGQLIQNNISPLLFNYFRANSWIKKNESPPLLKITQGLLSLLPLHSHSPGDEGEEIQSLWQQRKRNIVNCWHGALDQRKQFL